MYREFFSQSPLLSLPIVALVIFLVVFGGVIVTTLRRRAEEFDLPSRLPLADDEVRHER